MSDNTDPESSPLFKRKKTVKSVLSSSDSDCSDDDLNLLNSSDDEFELRNSRRGKRLRVSSSSSCSSINKMGRTSRKKRRVASSSSEDSGSDIERMRKKCHVVLDSESDSSPSSDSEVSDIFQSWSRERKAESSKNFTSNRIPPKISEDDSSNSSDDGKERCIICFKTLKPPMAQPSECSHNFHSDCLSTWSKTSNTCPIDRIKYTAINITGPSGELISRNDVKTPPPQDHNPDFEPDDATFCEECHQHDREHEMLLCDRCDSGYHMDCLTPPLTEVPSGQWYCPFCAQLVLIHEDEARDILSGAVVLENRFRNRPHRIDILRPIRPPTGPRTRGAQRVFNIIHQNLSINQPSTSTSRPTTQRRRKSRKRTKTKYKVELITVEDGSTIEVKLAVNSRKKRSKKTQKHKKKCRGNSSRQPTREVVTGDVFIPGSNSLDLFGSRPQLDYFSGCEAEDELDEDMGGGLGMLRRARTTVRGMAGRKQLAAQIFNSRPRRPIPKLSVSSAPSDLVSSILEQQNRWHNPNAMVQGTRNGDLQVVIKDQKSIPVKKSAGGNSGESSGINSNQAQEAPVSENNCSERTETRSLPPLQPPPQPPSKLCGEEDDFDLYADIEAPSCKLPPPPEPPAMLLAMEDEGGSSPEEACLIIDDERQSYDPDIPTSPPSPGTLAKAKDKEEPKKEENNVHVDLNDIRLPSSPDPEPASDSDCPNHSLYSKVSTEIAAESNSDSDKEDTEKSENVKHEAKEKSDKEKNGGENICANEDKKNQDDNLTKEKSDVDKKEDTGPKPFRMTLLPKRTLLPREGTDFAGDESPESVNEEQNEQEKSKENVNCSQESLSTEDKSDTKVNTSKSSSQNEKENDDVLELGCEELERDGLVDITDEEISTYEKSWELEDNNRPTSEKTVGLEGLETEAISDCEYTLAEDKNEENKTPNENGPKEEGEIAPEEVTVSPVAWKKLSKGTKERSYREKEQPKEKSSKKDKKKSKEKRKEIERYDVRKIINEKPKKRKVDEFGRDISSKSRSRSNSRKSVSVPKRRKSVEKRPRAPSRNRTRSRGRSRKKSRARSRSRSGSKRNKSRSPRRNKNREKSKDRKKRRQSSMSCSSCSCSSCDKDKRSNKKPTDRSKNSTKDRDRRRRYRSRNRTPKRRRYSPLPSKEVFTSGDNILVSVNFKSTKSNDRKDRRRKDEESSKKKKDKSSKENQPVRNAVPPAKRGSSKKRLNTKNLKPVAIIDLDQSPFREQTPSPKEIIILTDSDNEEKIKENENRDNVTGPKTPPEPHIKFNIVNAKPQIRNLSNPLLDVADQNEDDDEENDDEPTEIVHKGPNTPPEPPIPYDPFEPTKSRSPTPTQDVEDGNTTPTVDITNVRNTPEPVRVISPPKPQHEAPKTPSPLHSPKAKPQEENSIEKPKILPFVPSSMNDGDSDDNGAGGGGDSPYSPGSSEGDDLFEPPLPQMTTPVAKVKPRSIQSKHPPNKTLTPSKKKPKTPTKNSKGLTNKKEIGVKLDEDQLKILDEMPNSAVEMQVKDKFLKKLNRQERVVEEVKLVLKPHYAKKHINKDEYKEILRKSVPKICHSKSGEINPQKIQRLIEAYVKKYRHKKRRKPTLPIQSLQSLKPKPKVSMWC